MNLYEITPYDKIKMIKDFISQKAFKTDDKGKLSVDLNLSIINVSNNNENSLSIQIHTKEFLVTCLMTITTMINYPFDFEEILQNLNLESDTYLVLTTTP